MFIEVTDHLRCPAEHDEAFLVLVPDEVVDRSVRRGVLGCPVCRRQFPIVNGVPDFGGPGSRAGEGRPPRVPAGGPADLPDGGALLAFLGLEGAGGYAGLFGEAGRRGSDLERLLPGVHWLVVNPPGGATETRGQSLIRSPRSPVKSRSLRGVVLGPGLGADPYWQAEAARSVLPGLRVAGAGAGAGAGGAEPLVAGLELVAAAGGWWVARAVG
jgi:uncharacterized protein YbaR (Trm112 family)